MNEVDKPDFNMAVLFLTRLDKRLDERDIKSNEADFIGWYRILRSIYRNIHFKIDHKDDQDKATDELINKKFNEIKGLFNTQAGRNQNIVALTISKVEIILDEIDLLLNDLMFKHNLIFPKKQYQTFLEELESEMF